MFAALFAAVSADVLVPLLVAVIAAGPAYLGIRKARKENNADHAIGQQLLRDVLKGQTKMQVWQATHDTKHGRLNERLEALEDVDA